MDLGLAESLVRPIHEIDCVRYDFFKQLYNRRVQGASRQAWRAARWTHADYRRRRDVRLHRSSVRGREAVCGELLICAENQQFATHRITFARFCGEAQFWNLGWVHLRAQTRGHACFSGCAKNSVGELDLGRAGPARTRSTLHAPEVRAAGPRDRARNISRWRAKGRRAPGRAIAANPNDHNCFQSPRRRHSEIGSRKPGRTRRS